MKRDHNVDLVRILSCIAVLGLHSFQENLSSVNLLIYRLCGFAIPVFFLVSGYFLVIKGNTFHSSIKRIIRLLIIVVSWNIVVYLFELAQSVISQEHIDILQLPRSVVYSLLQKGRLWHFWYLGALMIVYILLPVISRIIRSNPQKKILVLWSVTCISGIVLQALSEFVFHDSLQRRIPQVFRLWCWIQYFLLGGVLQLYKDKWKGKRTLPCVIMLVATTICMLIYQGLVAEPLLHVLYGEAFYDSIITILWVLSIFVFVMNIRLSEKAISVIRFFAPCTLGVYIIHPLILRFLKAHFFPDNFVKSIAVFSILLISSFVFTYFIKKIPIIKKMVE